MSEEEQGFIVRDKRGRTEPDPSPAPTAEPPPEPAFPPNASEQSSESQEAGPPITFSSFVFSLGTSALMPHGRIPGS